MGTRIPCYILVHDLLAIAMKLIPQTDNYIEFQSWVPGRRIFSYS